MNRIVISEGGSVQYPMVRHATDIGWKPLTPQEALYRREGEDGMFLRGVLLGKLRQFNAWLTADAARAIVERLEAIPASIDGNRELLAWMRGERKWYDEGEKRHRAVVLIDFTPGADNELHVSTRMGGQAAGSQRATGQTSSSWSTESRCASSSTRINVARCDRTRVTQLRRYKWKHRNCSGQRSSSTSRICSTTGTA